MHITFNDISLISGSAKIVCSKSGNCPDNKVCYNLCVFFGFKDYGGKCVVESGQNLCCCVDLKDGGFGHATP